MGISLGIRNIGRTVSSPTISSAPSSYAGGSIRNIGRTPATSTNDLSGRIAGAQQNLTELGGTIPTKSPNILGWLLENLPRTGYGASNVLREFTNNEAGITPDKFDPLQAFGRGFTKQETPLGKDIMMDLGMSGDKAIFGGGTPHIYNPSPAGLAGLATDILNPLDPLNWVSFGLGGAVKSGGLQGSKALEKAFGTKGAQIAAMLGEDTIKGMGSRSVGKLTKQIATAGQKAGLDADGMAKLVEYLKTGMAEAGSNPKTKLPYWQGKPITVGLQNPLTFGMGKDFAQVPIKGSEHITAQVSKGISAAGQTRVGNTLSEMFNINHVDKNLPSKLFIRDRAVAEINNLVKQAMSGKIKMPATAEEIKALKEELNNLSVSNIYDVNKDAGGINFETIAGITGIDSKTLLNLFDNELPFTYSIPKLYNTLVKAGSKENEAFFQAARLRGVMDKVVDLVPNEYRSIFKGTIMTPNPGIRYYEGSPGFGKDIREANSSFINYVFNYKGIDIALPVNTSENFNPDMWGRLTKAMAAIDEMPKGNIQALKEQLHLAPVPLGDADGVAGKITGMFLNDEVTLSDPSHYTKALAHELGHVVHSQDKLAGGSFGNDFLKASRADQKDFVSEYSRTAAASEGFEVGLGEDIAESFRMLKEDPEAFAKEFPYRAAAVEKAMMDGKITNEEIKEILAKQDVRAEAVINSYGAGKQLDTILSKMDQSTYDILSKGADESIETQEAIKQFKTEISTVFERSLSNATDFVELQRIKWKDVPAEDMPKIIKIASSFTNEQVNGSPAFYSQINDRLNPTFHSVLRNVIDTKMPDNMNVPSLRNLLKQFGVKDEELEWSFMDKFFEGKSKVSKADVQEWLDWNSLELEEKILGGPIEGGTNSVSLDDFIAARPYARGVSSEILDRLMLELRESPDDFGDDFTDELLDSITDPEERAMFITDFENIYGGREMSDTHYGNSNYNEPGLKDYRELLIKLPRGFNAPKTGPNDNKLVRKNTPLSEKYGTDQKFTVTNRGTGEMFEGSAWAIDERIDEALTDGSFKGDEEIEIINEDYRRETIGVVSAFFEKPTIKSYSPPHFNGENNLVAHTRFDTRMTPDGKKILFVEEIQSDWHNSGWKDGYATSDGTPTYQELEDFTKDIGTANERARHFASLTDSRDWYYDVGLLGNFIRDVERVASPLYGMSSAKNAIKAYKSKADILLSKWEKGYQDDENYLEAAEYFYNEASKAQRLLDTLDNVGKVPDAPFKETYRNLISKRLLKYASENDFDGISWTTGAQQNERWSQTKKVYNINYSPETKTLFWWKDAAGRNGDQAYIEKPSDLKKYLTKEQIAYLTRPDSPKWSVRERDVHKYSDGSVTDYVEPPWSDRNVDAILEDITGVKKTGRQKVYEIVDEDGNVANMYQYKTAEEAQKNLDEMVMVGQDIRYLNSTKFDDKMMQWGGAGFRATYDEWIPASFEGITKKQGVRVQDIELGSPNISSKITTPFEDPDIRSEIVNAMEDIGVNGDETVEEMVAEFTQLAGNSIESADIIDIGLEENQYLMNFFMGIFDDITDEVAQRGLREAAKKNLKQYLDNMTVPGNRTPNVMNQKGIMFTPGAKGFFRENSQPLFMKRTEPDPDLEKVYSSIDELSPQGQEGLRSFIKWRESVVKEYEKRQIPINVLERYVPFVFTRKGNADEMDALGALFGTGSKPEGDDLSSVINWLSGYDPNLKPRTTQALNPQDVNAILKKDILSEDAGVIMATRGVRAIRAQDLYDFADTFSGKYGMTIDEMTAYGMPQGYKMYTPKTTADGRKVFEEVLSGKKIIEGDPQAVFLPEEMVKIYNQYADLIFGERGMNKLLKTYDKATSLYKKFAYLWNPGHIMRDFTGNVFNGYLMGLTNPKIYAEALEYLTNEKAIIKIPGMEKVTAKDFIKRAREHGILDIGGALNDFTTDAVIGAKKSSNPAITDEMRAREDM
jgi:hypothetical protein